MSIFDGWARFWAVDLHVHTPGSSDAKDADFGTAAEIVKIALGAGLSAIAVTDHNTAAWVVQMGAAAKGTDLVVLPGFELSTPDGHLLGIWEQGTKPSVLEDVLIRVGIERADFGKLDAVTNEGMSDCAKKIVDAGGVAVAAHIDKEKGLLTQRVQTHVNKLLADPNILAFEYVLSDTPAKVAAKLAGAREPALIQGSDAYDAALSRHAASGIGIRRTWVKAAKPDLCGIAYALDDPELRVVLSDPMLLPTHPTIDSLVLDGGFLGGVSIGLSPDLNSLLGGTGVGKSLALEAIRFVLEQQVNGAVFKTIADEVEHRLERALGPGSVVTVELSVEGERYRASRTYGDGSLSVVEQDVAGEWVGIERSPADLISIASFSQGEILEYARQPVGRMGLVDARVDLSAIDARLSAAEVALRTNAGALIRARDRVAELESKSSKLEELKERERQLSALFEADLVKSQSLWTTEQNTIATLVEQIENISISSPTEPAAVTPTLTPQHDAQFNKISTAQKALSAAVIAAEKLVTSKVAALKAVATQVRDEFDIEYKAFSAKLDKQVEKSGGASLKALRRELQMVQTNLDAATTAATELAKIARPSLAALTTERDGLLDDLMKARDDRRALRRSHALALNRLTANYVKIDIPKKGDVSKFRAELEFMKVGSRVQERVLDLIAEHVHPYSFVRALLTGDPTKAGPLPDGVTATEISRLVANVADHNMWDRVLECQLVDIPDVLNVKFKKPEGGTYVDIEDLSHGQKCTAILVLLLAEGDNPVLIDQPEDALHAPWIEEYLVNRLRALRGSRQYIFATRSPGLVVSADSEQLVTMRATATKGEVEASGSLERHDLNELALHHLEGGKVPFGRRAKKLSSSIS